ncbi:hypothetical protein NCS52_00903500 [Fusarium sp. LHS14.1]|nr:hypothetical protein NCS52_00903500 [Fusarium sp. LHS14.1]
MVASPPLTGLRVIELAGLAPGPFCGQLLSSYGASVLRVDHPAATNSDILASYKSSIVLDLKSQQYMTLLTTLLSNADVLIDPFRPGALEKLGLDPHGLIAANPRLIVLRLTGFRRDGKYKDMAGHDINYLAISGVLGMLGHRDQPPSPPGNMLADFAGGGLVAFAGVLLAIIQRSVSGTGQIVEANMVDGVNYIGTLPRLRTKELVWGGKRGTNLLDGGCPYYQCYECADHSKYMSVGAIEPRFFSNLLAGLGLSWEQISLDGFDREDRRSWPSMRAAFEQRFREKTRAEWEIIFEKHDACVAPVLEHWEMEQAGYQHSPMVHLSASPAKPIDAAWVGENLEPGKGGEDVLKDWVGWEKGIHYEINAGVFRVRAQKSRL